MQTTSLRGSVWMHACVRVCVLVCVRVYAGVRRAHLATSILPPSHTATLYVSTQPIAPAVTAVVSSYERIEALGAHGAGLGLGVVDPHPRVRVRQGRHRHAGLLARLTLHLLQRLHPLDALLLATRLGAVHARGNDTEGLGSGAGNNSNTYVLAWSNNKKHKTLIHTYLPTQSPTD